MPETEFKTIKKYINVNTKFRPYVKDVQPKNTDFVLTLPTPIRNVLSMKLKSFTSPDVEYTFSVTETNNSFEIIINNTTTTVSVIPGKYFNPGPDGQSLLINQINSQIKRLGISLTFIPELQRYAFTGNNISKIELNFDVRNNYIYNTFGWILGFHKSYYSKDTKYSYAYPRTICAKETGLVGGLASIGSNQYYLADAEVLLPNTSFYYMLYVDDYLSNVEDAFYEGCFPSNNNAKNILAQITTKYALDNNTFYETDTDASFERVYSGPVTLNKLHIRLFDDNNNIVDFNNADYSFLLEIVTRI